MANIMEKQCAGCKTPKKPNDFYKNKSTGDGISIYCKECTKLNAKKYYQKKLIKAVNKETILRKNLNSIKIVSDKKVKLKKQSTDSPIGIETSLKIALMEKHLATALNLLQEYKQERELFGV